AIAEVSIDLVETRCDQHAVVRRGAIADAVEAQARTPHAGAESVARRESTGPSLFRRQREPTAVFMTGGELGMSKSDRAVDREPRSKLVAGLELHAVASRRRPSAGRALVATPGGLAIEVEQPTRHREVEALPEARARADFLADGARERSHGGLSEAAAHVIRVKAMAPVQVQIELGVLAIQRCDRQARFGAELMRAIDAALGATRFVAAEPIIHGEAQKIGAAAKISPEPGQRRDFFVHIGAKRGLMHVVAAQLPQLRALQGVPQLFVNVVAAHLTANRGVEANPA